MRKILLILLSLILITSPLNAGGNRWTNKPPVGSQINWGHPLAKGLVGAWLMNEGGGNIVKDIAGKNNGVLTGSYDKGNVLFTDEIKKINVGSSAILVPPNEMTIVFSGMLHSWNLGLPNLMVERPYTSAVEPYYSYRLTIVNDSHATIPKRIAGQITLNGVRKVLDPTSAAPQISLKIPFQAALTHKSGEQKLYHNNINTTTFSNTGTINDYSTNTQFGRSAIFGTHGFLGWVRYVYIYNRCLSPSEINQLYQDPYCFIKPPTIWSNFSTAVAAARRMFMAQ